MYSTKTSSKPAIATSTRRICSVLVTLCILSAGADALSGQTAQPSAHPVSHGASAQRRRAIPKTNLPPSAKRFYESTWGVDIIGVKAVESGTMLRFSYRILDADKAQALNDKKVTPELYDLTSHSRLEVPSMEKVGQLRQSSAVEQGHVYWMVFSNPERYVKPGTRVDIRIGQFLAQGLLVE
jgi:hypothetical protein